MTTKILPSAEYLRKRLRYAPETGKLYWLDCEDMPNAWRAKHREKEAFICVGSHGYRCGAIDGRLLLAHRVLWALVSGAWPEGQLDHKNGDKQDNRLENLRAVSHKENHKNVSRRVDNTSGACGVTWDRVNKKWRAQIVVDGVLRHIGRFVSFDDAVAARKAAAREHGFTDRHGT